MPEWLVERGIGETRAALIEHDSIIESMIELDGVLPVGSLVEARLIDVGHGNRNAVARTEAGQEILLPLRPAGVSQGGRLVVEITREAIPGNEPWKRPLGRMSAEPARPVPDLAERLNGTILPFPPVGQDLLERAGWSDLLAEAASGEVSFAGGQLRLFATPAMTLIDVDGFLPPDELAVAGAAAAGRAIRRLAIGGSIGIDLPTVRGKDSRAAGAEALDQALDGTRFERTAVNGFGFLQIVRPRRRPSLLELYADRASTEARALLRRAAVSGFGPVRLAAHPLVISVIEANPEWLERLARQRGGAVTLRSDPTLAISGGHAELA